jgi:hypothetical protein
MTASRDPSGVPSCRIEREDLSGPVVSYVIRDHAASVVEENPPVEIVENIEPREV